MPRIFKRTDPQEDFSLELEIKCHDPRLALVPVLRESRGTLAMTGTYDKVFYTLLGYKALDQIYDRTRIYRAHDVTGESPFLVLCDYSIDSRYEDRPENNPEYARRISWLIDLIPRNILVFTTSYTQAVLIHKKLAISEMMLLLLENTKMQCMKKERYFLLP